MKFLVQVMVMREQLEDFNRLITTLCHIENKLESSTNTSSWSW
jgi:hypothetical protein